MQPQHLMDDGNTAREAICRIEQRGVVVNEHGILCRPGRVETGSLPDLLDIAMQRRGSPGLQSGRPILPPLVGAGPSGSASQY
jgi:hypothetical protein